MPDHQANVNDPQLEEIDGGTVGQWAEIETRPPHREATARTIAYALLWILGLSAVLHYIAIVALIINGKEASAELISRFFNAWLPVVAGLVGSATTYYFTKDRS